MQHKLLQCCFIVLYSHSVQCFSWLFYYCLLLHLFVVAPAAAVGTVLGVDEHLHLELGSQGQLCHFLFLYFYGFNLSLKKQHLSVGKQLVSSKVTLLETQEATSVLTPVKRLHYELQCEGVCNIYPLNLHMQNFKNENNNNNNLGDFYQIRKASKAAVGQLDEDLANSICSTQTQAGEAASST